MHPGNGPGLSPRRSGQKFGTESNTLSIAQMPSHKHNVSLPAKEEADTEVPQGNFIAGAGFDGFGTTSDATLGALPQDNIGGGQSINNIQPVQCVNFIIALVGTFPSRS